MRIILWVLAGAAALSFGALFLLKPASETPPASSTPLNFGGAFTLTGGDGRPFSSAALAGKPYAIFFGFIHCPDVCPTTLARLVRLRAAIKGAGDQLQIVFVTVDPERDGPKEVASYAALFGEGVIGLTGDPQRIAQVKRQFGIYSAKVPDGSGGYSVDHTATVLLFDRDGRFVATISPDENDSAALDKVTRITRSR